MTRIGLFGGSFDPVHNGHLLAALSAAEELPLDRLFFVPACRSPFKEGARPLEARARLRLLRLALQGLPGFSVCGEEIARGGTSYTVDTVRRFAARHPGARLWWLVGEDLAGSLPQWKEAGALASLACFAVIPRPGAELRTLPGGFRIRRLQGTPAGISSSELRARIGRGASLRGLVPEAVAEAIAREGLYRDPPPGS